MLNCANTLPEWKVIRMVSSLAPVCMFVYKRAEHTLLTLESLSKNSLAPNTDLIIFSDYSENPSDSKAIQEVRALIRSVKGFKSIKIIERNKNYGLAQNIIDGVTKTIAEYGKIIVLEDDMVVSPFFLKYMNDALVKYENTDQVVSIHGYIYPTQKELPETFFLRGADCWGWATWKRGWDIFEQDGAKLLRELNEKKLTYDFDFYNSHSYTKMLKDQITGKNNSWAIRWYASAFLNNKLTLYPGKSYVHNIGNDSSGTHCTKTQKFDVELCLKESVTWPEFIAESNSSKKVIANYFLSLQSSFLKKTISILKRSFA